MITGDVDVKDVKKPDGPVENCAVEARPQGRWRIGVERSPRLKSWNSSVACPPGETRERALTISCVR